MVSPLSDPYRGKANFTLVAERTLTEGQTERVYKQQHQLVWQIYKGLQAFLGTILLIPLLINFKAIQVLWKQALTGQEEKTIRVASEVFFPEPVLVGDPSVSKEQVRRLPPISVVDTLAPSRNGQLTSAHSSVDIYKDADILQKEPIIREVLYQGKPIFYTRHNKAIFLQQARRGCTGAVVEMLCFDHNKTPIVNSAWINLGNEDSIIASLKGSGLTPLVTDPHCANQECFLKELRTLILANGSAIVSQHGNAGGHVIIVDEIAEDLQSLRIRDPGEGWEITVKAHISGTAYSGPVIQVEEERNSR